MPSAAYLLVQVIALIFVWRHGFRVWHQVATGLADVGSHDSVAIPVGSVVWTLVGFSAALIATGVLGWPSRRFRGALSDESPLLIRSDGTSDSARSACWPRAVGGLGEWSLGRWAWIVATMGLIGLLYYLVPPLAVLLTVTIPAIVLLALITWTASLLPLGWLGLLAFLSFLATFLVGAVETGLDQSHYGYSLLMMALTVSFLIGLPLNWSADTR